MDVIIVLFISCIGSYFYEIDFCTLFTFITVANDLCKYTDDKTAKRQIDLLTITPKDYFGTINL